MLTLEFDFALKGLAQACTHGFPVLIERARQINVVRRVICTENTALGVDMLEQLIDLRKTGVTGKELQRRLDEVYITANKNAIPNDPESPFVTSGQRIGTPAVTTRGFGKPEMLHIAEFIWQAATDFDNKADEIRRNVCEICSRFPIY